MKIINFKEINKGLMMASFDLVMEEWGLTIRKLTLFHKNTNKWVSFPSQKYETKDGGTSYYPYVVMEKDRKERLEKVLIEMIAKGEYDTNAPKQEEPPF